MTLHPLQKRKELTDVILMVDDGVEGGILVLDVPFCRLHVVDPLEGFNKALKSSVHHWAVSQWALLAWRDKEES